MIISPCQSAFISGRSILDNILLSHDLLRSFHLTKGKPKMFLKLDLNKAFDSVKWSFPQDALLVLNFLMKGIQWWMECVQQPGSPSSSMVNRAVSFKAKGAFVKDALCPLTCLLLLWNFFLLYLLNVKKMGLCQLPLLKESWLSPTFYLLMTF